MILSEIALRRCFRAPIAEIFAAADRLVEAIDAHRRGDRPLCHELISQADDPVVREWARPFLASARHNPYIAFRQVDGEPPLLAKLARVPVRMPTQAQKAELIGRQGRHCAFCEIPLVRVEVRKALQAAYPGAARWGRSNNDCHAALLCMWLQYDHVLPHSRGGDNSLDNVVLTCAPCNYGRMSRTLAEVGLEDPRGRSARASTWHGLEPFLASAPADRSPFPLSH